SPSPPGPGTDADTDAGAGAGASRITAARSDSLADIRFRFTGPIGLALFGSLCRSCFFLCLLSIGLMVVVVLSVVLVSCYAVPPIIYISLPSPQAALRYSITRSN